MQKRVFGISILIIFVSACSLNNVSIDQSLGKFFDSAKVNGCFAFFDNGQGHFIIYNLKRYRDSAYLPASTFKIVNSLIGIETGRISNEKMVLPWNGKTHFYPNGDTARDWDRDLTMEEAFKISAVPYFQEIARRIGRDTMQYWLDSLHYGNHRIGGAIDSFWLDNSLKITADEQLGLVKKLYFEQLPFFQHTQKMVSRLMLMESNANYQLSYKTGWGYTAEGHALGWILGWVEENKHPYFFVLNMETPERRIDMGATRIRILRGILKQLGFFQGKK